MKSYAWTPADRLRPLQRIENGCQPRIEYANGKYVIRQSGVRLDPAVTPSERWFYDRFLPTCEGLAVWVAVPVLAWWAIFTVLPWLYSFAFHHPFGL